MQIYCYGEERTSRELWKAVKKKHQRLVAQTEDSLGHKERKTNNLRRHQKITRKTPVWEKAPEKSWWHAARHMQNVGASRKAHGGLEVHPNTNKKPQCLHKEL